MALGTSAVKQERSKVALWPGATTAPRSPHKSNTAAPINPLLDYREGRLVARNRSLSSAITNRFISASEQFPSPL